jgi:pSer/pThr/pTyr-binding forkhead associated (FHA) protein
LSHIYCPECGFQNPESANFCSKCGTALVRDPAGGDTTMAFTPEELDEDSPLEALGMEGPALVVRSGGGRAGEHFVPQSERTTIGRSPDCDIFLDDVTVSRSHAILLREGGSFVIEDQGSLNGTFVNRRRIDSSPLSDGDEVQIGKYRLTFLQGADSAAPTRRGGGGVTPPPTS